MLYYLFEIFFYFNDTATTEIYTLSLHDALPIWWSATANARDVHGSRYSIPSCRSEEHTSELQSRRDLVCRLLLEKKKKIYLLSVFVKKDTINYCNNIFDIFT